WRRVGQRQHEGRCLRFRAGLRDQRLQVARGAGQGVQGLAGGILLRQGFSGGRGGGQRARGGGGQVRQQRGRGLAGRGGLAFAGIARNRSGNGGAGGRGRRRRFRRLQQPGQARRGPVAGGGFVIAVRARGLVRGRRRGGGRFRGFLRSRAGLAGGARQLVPGRGRVLARLARGGVGAGRAFAGGAGVLRALQQAREILALAAGGGAARGGRGACRGGLRRRGDGGKQARGHCDSPSCRACCAARTRRAPRSSISRWLRRSSALRSWAR